jgi:small subunit ribosomal protein S6
VTAPSPMMKEEKSKTIIGDKETVEKKEEETSES